MKLALIADWLPTFGGAEHVIAEFATLWPDAPIFTTVARHGHLGPLDRAQIRTSPLQPWYRLIRRHELLLPWMPRAIEMMDLKGYDIILSSSHAIAKGVIPPSGAVHICYCHTPMRYAWEMEEEYLRDFHVPHLLRRSVKRFLKQMRRLDLVTAKRVDVFLANSQTTQERIARIYARPSTVVPPPVQNLFFSKPLPLRPGHSQIPTPYPLPPTPYLFAIGRLVPYKRFDLLIEAANILRIPLKIAGTGRDERRLKRMAGPTVSILGHVSDEHLLTLYAGADAVLVPQIEDAGVVPLEAQACGTPVLALRRGGVVDTVREGITGIFFEEQSVPAICHAIEKLKRNVFDPSAIRAHARQFGSKRFREQVREAVESTERETTLRRSSGM